MSETERFMIFRRAATVGAISGLIVFLLVYILTGERLALALVSLVVSIVVVFLFIEGYLHDLTWPSDESKRNTSRGWTKLVERKQAEPRRYGEQEPWYGQTDIGLLEKLKAELKLKEEQLPAANFARRVFEEKTAEFKKKWFSRWWIDTFKTDHQEEWALVTTVSPDAPRLLYDKINRLWKGNAHKELADLDVQIKKQKIKLEHGAALEQETKELLVELERDKADIQELVRRAQEHEYKRQFDDKKAKRRWDVQDEVFEAFERPFEKEMELRAKYHEMAEKIKTHPHMSREEKTQSLDDLEQQFKLHLSKDKPKKPAISIYRKEA